MQLNKNLSFNKGSSYDIIIVGAGMVGLTFAILCAQKNFSVALVDQTLPHLNWDPLSYDKRVTAVSRASQQIFASLGVWEAMCRERVKAYDRMHVWDSIGFGNITFTAEEVNEPDLGHIIENRVIVKALWEKLESYETITRYLPYLPKALLNKNIKSKEINAIEDKINTTQGMVNEAEQIILELEPDRLLYAKLLVGADGGSSWVRKSKNIKTQDWDYKQKALVATVTTEFAHEDTAWQRFLKNGSLAFLPLTDCFTSSIVWSTSTEDADSLLNLPNESFCEELGFNFDYRLGKVTSVKDRACFPLSMRHAEHYIDERIALIGDAAHVIHPFAGLGVNLGIQDTKGLIEVIENAREEGNDIGHKLILRRFERRRRTEILGMLTALEFIKRIFDVKSPSLTFIRSIAINGINRINFLKDIFIHKAMGA